MELLLLLLLLPANAIICAAVYNFEILASTYTGLHRIGPGNAPSFVTDGDLHYGMIVDGDRLWAIRRRLERQPGEADTLVEFNMQTGVVEHERMLTVQFAHDAVRAGDSVYVASTGVGEVVEHHFPSWEVKKTHALFDRKDHINTLAVNGTDLLVMSALHKGKSVVNNLRKAASGNFEVKGTSRWMGSLTHGMVLWRDRLVYLDSVDVRLMLYRPEDNSVEEVWVDLSPGMFLKGLVVVDDAAIFGRCKWGSRHARKTTSCQLITVDLRAGRLLSAASLPFTGLINALNVPSCGSHHLACSKFIVPRDTVNVCDGCHLLEEPKELIPIDQLKNCTSRSCSWRSFGTQDLGPFESYDFNAPPIVALEKKRKFDTSQMKWLVLSDNSATQRWLFPEWETWQAPIMDLLRPLGIKDECRVLRAQFRLLGPKEKIARHRDTGLWASLTHRIHLAVVSDGKTCFHMMNAQGQYRSVYVKPGMLFEVNNMMSHWVDNLSEKVGRIHMLVDVLDDCRRIDRSIAILPEHGPCEYGSGGQLRCRQGPTSPNQAMQGHSVKQSGHEAIVQQSQEGLGSGQLADRGPVASEL